MKKLKLSAAITALIFGVTGVVIGTTSVAQSLEEPIFQCTEINTLTGASAEVAHLINTGVAPEVAIEQVLSGLVNLNGDIASAVTQAAICAAPDKATEITNAAIEVRPDLAAIIADAGILAGADPVAVTAPAAAGNPGGAGGDAGAPAVVIPPIPSLGGGGGTGASTS